jgi:EpsD family peptidyl-prolyl cis-trans isomerase
MTTRNSLELAVALTVLMALGGCNKDEGQKAATQVAAKVNGAEITVTQVNNILSRANGVTADNAPAAKREILDKLIDQQLAVEQAMDKKLDRNPNVMQAIEAAKREILSRAYLEQIAAAQPKPTADEVKKFYIDHPELFSQRRLYNLQELAVAASGTAADEIKQMANSGKSMQDIANALKARNIQFRANAGPSAAEQLPIEILPKFHALKDGETAVIQGPQALLVVHLVASQAQPIDEAAALPRIEQFIANQRNAEAVGKEMKALRDKAKIDRLGEFAATTPAPAAPAAAAPATPAPAAAAPTPAADAAPTAPGAVDDKAIAKGVAGLK